VKSSFLQAVAAAARVNLSNIVINNVLQVGNSRRLNSMSVQIHTTILGAMRLHKLDQHLEKRAKGLHAGHHYKHAHRVEPIEL